MGGVLQITVTRSPPLPVPVCLEVGPTQECRCHPAQVDTQSRLGRIAIKGNGVTSQQDEHHAGTSRGLIPSHSLNGRHRGTPATEALTWQAGGGKPWHCPTPFDGGDG